MFIWEDILLKDPPIKKLVLMQIEEAADHGLIACVVLGYFKNSVDGNYYRVHPGADIGAHREVTHWCDCLDDNFSVPDWPGTPF